MYLAWTIWKRFMNLTALYDDAMSSNPKMLCQNLHRLQVQDTSASLGLM